MSAINIFCMIDMLMGVGVITYVVGSEKSLYQIAFEIRQWISKYFK